MFEMESEDVDSPVIPPKRKAFYFPDSQILIFTMPGRLHELLSREINRLLSEKISRMNCLEELAATGAATERLQNLSKEPDESWGPEAVDYPTCVLEVGLSESRRRLDRDAQRWIENEVSQVITVKIYPHRHGMMFAILCRTAPGRPRRTTRSTRFTWSHMEADRGSEIIDAYASPLNRSLSDRPRAAPPREM
jgi:hypothetical protein